MPGGLDLAKYKRIALIMGQDLGYCRDVLRGVQAYAKQHQTWVFHDAAPTPEILGPLREWKPHGIIAHLFEREIADGLRALRVPLVNVTSTLTDLTFPMVEVDHLAVGGLAAAHFLDNGFTSFGYFGSRVTGFSIGREKGFRDHLHAAGFDCSTCHAEYLPRPQPGGSWTDVDFRVRQWLKTLPKPVGVLASNDTPARELAEICRLLNYNVPTDVAILGVDNDEVETGLSYPPLSSIAIPGERIGFEAAAMLGRMMAKPRSCPESLILPPQGVVVRESSDAVAISDPDLAAVLGYIRRHATEPIGVEDVLGFVNISRRKIERRFRGAMHRTIHDEIRRVRLERVKRLLATTDLAMDEVAKMSGFDGARRLAVVFGQQTGSTPTAYRREFRLR